VKPAHPSRHLVRARDLADLRYASGVDVEAMAAAAGLSKAHFSREFKRVFGETPHQYLLTRRLERAAALLRSTDHTVAQICLEVGLQSIGSFTTSFTKAFGRSPTAYRADFPLSSAIWRVPPCMVRQVERPLPARPPVVPGMIPPPDGR
jgi:AraC-like DNA-binding protein